jgi:hypothetical protein
MPRDRILVGLEQALAIIRGEMKPARVYLVHVQVPEKPKAAQAKRKPKPKRTTAL